jgi:hypothetical protein
VFTAYFASIFVEVCYDAIGLWLYKETEFKCKVDVAVNNAQNEHIDFVPTDAYLVGLINSETLLFMRILWGALKFSYSDARCLTTISCSHVSRSPCLIPTSCIAVCTAVHIAHCCRQLFVLGNSVVSGGWRSPETTLVPFRLPDPESYSGSSPSISWTRRSGGNCCWI